jgi:hypothetical protein
MLRGKHKLMRDGAPGEAVVLREQRRGAGTRDWRQYIDARFEGADGTAVEFSDHVLRSDVGLDFVDVGDMVPVRYDPGNHRQIVLDVPRLKAQIAARHAGGEPIPAPAGEGLAPPAGDSAAPEPEPLTPDAVAAALEQMANLGELRHRHALGDAEYDVEKAKLQDLMRRRSSGAISQAQFDAENTLRLASLPSSSSFA